MSDALVVGLISAAVSLIAIIVSSKDTRDKVTQKLDTNQRIIENEVKHIKTEITDMKNDIKTHNHYAKLFDENIPVIKEKLSTHAKELTNVREDIKFYHRTQQD
jgi:peptidoglycan hydrolase CwlO-like protein